MDVLSAATETVANADAMAAAAATLSVAAASASAASTSSGVSSPRPASPATSTSTKGGGSRADGSEMDEDDARSSRSLDSSSTAAAAAAAMSAVAAAAAAATPAPSLSPAVRDEHAKLEAQAEDIRNGKHPKLLAEMESQDRIKRRRIESAEISRDLITRNVEELRAAEVTDSDVQTKVSLERTQEALLDDVHQRIRKAKVDGGMVPSKEASGGIAAGDGEDKTGEGLLVGKKRARMMPSRPLEKVTPEAVLAKAEARRIRSITLSDMEMRRDFQAIIADWRERATKYLSTYNNSHWTKVNVSPDSFRVRGVTFAKGDPVIVTSRVTGEEFHGEITVVKPKAVFLSLYGGVKTKIFVDHISTGRLTVARADSKNGH